MVVTVDVFATCSVAFKRESVSMDGMIEFGGREMLQQKSRYNLVLSLCAMCLFVFGFSGTAGAWKKKGTPRWKTKKRTYASLYIAQTPFPGSASTVRKLKHKAWKHRKRVIRWGGGRLNLHFMLFVDKGRILGTSRLYMVLFKPGSRSKYFDSQILRVNRKTRRLTSPISFSGGKLKRGKRYELRAIRIRGRGKRRYEQTIARTYFRLK